MEEYRIRYGIKLYKRLCKICKGPGSVFWVPKSSPIHYCCKECRIVLEEWSLKKKCWPGGRRKKRNQHDACYLREEDYE